jgi:hypothetical protein
MNPSVVSGTTKSAQVTGPAPSQFGTPQYVQKLRGRYVTQDGNIWNDTFRRAKFPKAHGTDLRPLPGNSVTGHAHVRWEVLR